MKNLTAAAALAVFLAAGAYANAPAPQRPTILHQGKRIWSANAWVDILPSEDDKRAMRFTLTMTGPGTYAYSITRDGTGLTLRSGEGVYLEDAEKELSETFPYVLPESEGERVRYTIKAEYTPYLFQRVGPDIVMLQNGDGSPRASGTRKYTRFLIITKVDGAFHIFVERD